MELKHMHKRALKNSLFRVVNELDEKMYPRGLKDELKYIEDLNTVFNRKYSKVELANMLRQIMSYVILTNSLVFSPTVPLAKKVVKAITVEETSIVIGYIIANNQHIAKLCQTLTQNDSRNNIK